MMADSIRSEVKIQLFGTRTLICLVVCLAAWQSNPGSEHLRKWLRRTYVPESQLDTQQLVQVTYAIEPNLEVLITSFGFCSVAQWDRLVVNADTKSATVEAVYLWGAFGNWWIIPSG